MSQYVPEHDALILVIFFFFLIYGALRILITNYSKAQLSKPIKTFGIYEHTLSDFLCLVLFITLSIEKIKNFTFGYKPSIKASQSKIILSLDDELYLFRGNKTEKRLTDSNIFRPESLYETSTKSLFNVNLK